jgi:CTP synthase (UTP-ammonia lyase)
MQVWFQPSVSRQNWSEGTQNHRVDLERGVRIVELSTHRFYVATLFLPQVSSRPESPYPLIVAYLRTALAFQSFKRNNEIKM